MTESFFINIMNALIPLTIVLSFLLVIRPFLLKYCGAQTSYFSWFALPIALLTYQLLPALIFPIETFQATNNIERVLVTSAKSLEQVNNMQWLMYLSFTVASLLFTVVIINHLRFSRKLSYTQVVNNKLVSQYIEPLIGDRKLGVVMSNEIECPLVIGIFKPMLILPTHFFTLYNSEQQQLIVAHEICHFDRNDIYWNQAAFLCVALFWFHPLVWLSYIRFRRDQELSCDQTTLARKQLDSRINYSRALLIAAQQQQRFTFAHISFNEYGDKTMMLERISQIKHNTILGKSGFVLYGLLVATLMTGVSYAGHVGQQGSTNDEAKHGKAIKDDYPIMRVEPKYPIQAAKDGVEGAVVLKFDINTAGHTENIQVITGTPEKVFDKVAIAALSKWTYKQRASTRKNNLVQLDFLMDNSSSTEVDLIERINVSKH